MATRFSSITDPARSGAPRHAVRPPLLNGSAIVGGAVAVCVVSLLLYGVGTMAGWEGALLWPTPGARSTPANWASLAWMALTPLVAAAVGGSVAGRMRSSVPDGRGDRWHGLLAWALGTALTAVVMATAGHSVVRTAHHAADSAIGRDVRAMLGVTGQALASDVTRSAKDIGVGAQDVNDWALDLARNKGLTEEQKQGLRLRTEQALAHTRAAAALVKEVGSVLARSVEKGVLTDSDARSVAQQIAQRSDLTLAEAQRAVEQTFAQMQHPIATARTQAQAVQQSAQSDAEKIAGVADQALGTPWLWAMGVVVLAALIGMASARRGHRRRPTAAPAPSVP